MTHAALRMTYWHVVKSPLVPCWGEEVARGQELVRHMINSNDNNNAQAQGACRTFFSKSMPLGAPKNCENAFSVPA